jgi:hypothetical protein
MLRALSMLRNVPRMLRALSMLRMFRGCYVICPCYLCSEDVACFVHVTYVPRMLCTLSMLRMFRGCYVLCACYVCSEDVMCFVHVTYVPRMLRALSMKHFLLFSVQKYFPHFSYINFRNSFVNLISKISSSWQKRKIHCDV